MSISRITSGAQQRRFIVYDLEWYPLTVPKGCEAYATPDIVPGQLRLVGVTDGERYRYYLSVKAFLEHELSSDNRGAWFVAHAGGLADMNYVLEEIIRHGGYQVQAAFSGSSAVIVHLRQGKNAWHFVDSLWLMRAPLREIGTWIGETKGGSVEDKSTFYAPLPELIDYNAQDCNILWRAMDMLQKQLLEMGGQLQMTLASCAMQLFRRRYLTTEISTGNWLNQRASNSYIASRVEVFQRNCQDALYFDINSSFPFSMTKPCPGEMLGTSKHLPTSWGDPDDAHAPLFLAQATIEVPESFLPPLPWRSQNRIFFPWGRWRSWFSSVDLRLLLDAGGTIAKVDEVITFAPFFDLADYAKDLYTKRKQSPAGFGKSAYKLLLNSLYGKFAESQEKQEMLIHPKTAPDDQFMLMPGIYLVPRMAKVPHRHVPIAAHITSLSRRWLWEYLSFAQPHVYYCDTDSLITKTDLAPIPSPRTGRALVGNELGQLKLEKTVENGTFIQSKVYRTDEEVKAKGFSKLTVADFERLIHYQEIEFHRMGRVREMYRMHRVGPAELLLRKKISPHTRPKRFTYPDGTTRPWNVAELYGQWVPDAAHGLPAQPESEAALELVDRARLALMERDGTGGTGG